jgi:thiol-disulfide isomerase/thioredoxin
MRRLVATLAVLLTLALLAGCTASNAMSEQARAGDAKNYVAGDGSITMVAADQRGEPVELAGPTGTGEQLSVTAWRGDVVVLNVWYAGCAPCRAEAPDLASVAREEASRGVRFLGINTRDGAAAAEAFERSYDLPYPSILDASTGAALLALRGQVPPQAVPSTLVLDRQGRIAARVLGRVDASTLRGLVEDVAGERA